jgi:hypothetical protein
MLHFPRSHNISTDFGREFSISRKSVHGNINGVLVDGGVWNVVESVVVGEDGDF